MTDTMSVVIIAGGPSDELERCLSSLGDLVAETSQLVLFGNGSSLDETARRWASRLACKIVTGHADRNLGVAAGRNRAAELATGSLLFFIDDDATIEPGAIDAAVREFADPTVGGVAMHIVDPASSSTALWYLGDALKAQIARGRPFDVPWMIGCGQIIRRATFDALGGFWEGYFREEEEIDLGLRIVDSGQRIRFVPNAVVLHPDRTKMHLTESISSNPCMSVRLIPLPTLALRLPIKLLAYTRHAVRLRALGPFVRGLLLAGRRLPSAIHSRRPLSDETLGLVLRSLEPVSMSKRLQW